MEKIKLIYFTKNGKKILEELNKKKAEKIKALQKSTISVKKNVQ